MESGPTRIPEVVDALVLELRKEYDANQVVDGPRGIADLPDDVILIGYAPEGEVAIENEVTRAEGLGHRYNEVFNIKCLISCFDGNRSMKATRDRATAILANVEAILKASQGLTGTADLVGLGPAQSWGQEQSQDGTVVEIAFTVVGRAAL